MEQVPVILGTAGHIDHGKTSLVRALTGIDTDRLAEEKRRGITIELGFAHLDVAGRRFGVVDVPGHERFLKTMVAGAAGVDIAMLVVAADEGVMPQTREHLQVCQLLGIRAGLVAVTKADLVDAEWLELVRSELTSSLAGTFLASAPIIPVSSLSGAGLDALRDTLFTLAGHVTPRRDDGPFRLPLDRVFSVHGFGTVVTGTIASGAVSLGDELLTVPGHRRAKVRSLEVHGVPVERARAGMRCAINLAGLDRQEVARGETLVHPEAVLSSQLLDVRLHYGKHSAAALGSRTRLLVHHGTAQLGGQVLLVDREQLAPGDEALAQLRLERPVPAVPGDRFILRGFTLQAHHGTTVGGGEVIRVVAPKIRRSSAGAQARLAAFASASAGERLALEVQSTGPATVTAPELCARLGWSAADVDAGLARLVEARELLVADGRILHAATLAVLEAAALAAITRFHDENPTRPGIPREELRSRLPRALPPRMFDALVGELAGKGAVTADGDHVSRARVAAPGADSPLAAALRDACAALDSPRPVELAARLGQPERAIKEALAALGREGTLVRIRDDYHVGAAALGALRQRLLDHLTAHGQITPQEWKELVGLSRKFTIPLAEHFDTEKVTLRIGDLRRRR